MEPEIWHVEPSNDLKEHVTKGLNCHCKPAIDVQPNGSKLVIHNAYDGREFDELEKTVGH